VIKPYAVIGIFTSSVTGAFLGVVFFGGVPGGILIGALFLAVSTLIFSIADQTEVSDP
jgi:uncharacterized membrane protein (DUF441 family)